MTAMKWSHFPWQVSCWSLSCPDYCAGKAGQHWYGQAYASTKEEVPGTLASFWRHIRRFNSFLSKCPGCCCHSAGGSALAYKAMEHTGTASVARDLLMELALSCYWLTRSLHYIHGSFLKSSKSSILIGFSLINPPKSRIFPYKSQIFGVSPWLWKPPYTWLIAKDGSFSEQAP